MRSIFLVVVGLLLVSGVVSAQEYYTPECAVAGEMERQPWYYTVEPGDCLWIITEKAGNHGINYTVLVAYNKHLFIEGGRSVDLIYAGEKLRVPEGWAYGLGIAKVTVRLLDSSSQIDRIVSLGEAKSKLAGDSPFAGLGALFLICGMAMLLYFWRPWNIFRPGNNAFVPSMVEGGVTTAQGAVETIRQHIAEDIQRNPERAVSIQQPFVIKRLWEVRLYGLLQVRYADGSVEEIRCGVGQKGWLAELSDGSKHILLQKCGNDVRTYGRTNKLIDGRYEIIREVRLDDFNTTIEVLEVVLLPSVIIVEEEDSETETEPQPEPQPEETATRRRMMYPFHPCVLGRTARMIRLAAAVRGGGLRR